MGKKNSTIVWVPYYANDLITGVECLTADEELAYRRVLDYIIITKDELKNDDPMLARVTRMPRKWRKVKASLIDKGKLQIDGDFIRNKRMTQIIARVKERQKKLSGRGKAAAQARWGRHTNDD